MPELLLRDHDNGPVPGHRLSERLPRDQAEPHALVAGLDLYPHARASLDPCGRRYPMPRKFQCGEVTSLRCGHEGIEKAPLIARTHERAPAIGDTLASTRRKLTSVCFFESKDVRDLAIWVVERLPKNVHGSFRRREALLQHPERGPQRFAPFRSGSGVGAGVHWFPNPAPGGSFAARAGGPDDVDRQSCRGPREERRRVPDHAAISRLPPHPDVLHRVLGLGHTSEHAVRDAEQARPHTKEGRESIIICTGVHGGYHRATFFSFPSPRQPVSPIGVMSRCAIGRALPHPGWPARGPRRTGCECQGRRQRSREA